MSFHLEGPGVPVLRDPVTAIQEMHSYLTRTINQLNYALGFLDLPDASPSAVSGSGPDGRVAGISERSTNAQIPSAKAVYNYAAPQSRTVNGHPLTEDVTLTSDDVGAVPISRAINGHELTEDVTITAAELGAEEIIHRVTSIEEDATDDTYPTTKAVLDHTAVGDKILEIGQESGWTFRKWNSGICEAFGFDISASIEPITPEPGSSPPYENEAEINIPSPLFIDADYAAFVSIADSDGIYAGTVLQRTTTSMKIKYLDYQAIGTIPKANIYLIGKWRRD